MISSFLLFLGLCPILWGQGDTAPVGKNCKIKKTDVIFALDSSSSIIETDFQTMMEFVLAFVDDSPTIGPNGTQVGIYTFGDNYQHEIPLGSYQDKESLKSAIKAIKKLGGMTNTHLVLDDIMRNGFNARSGARSNVQRAVVMVTDGESLRPNETIRAAEALHRAKIFTFAIGVGKDVNPIELKKIASNEKTVINVQNYEALKTIEKQVNEVICEHPQSKCQTVLTDVIFILDSSSSINPTDFKKQLDFVSKFIEDCKEIGPNGTQVGVYTFANESKLNFPLGIYHDKLSMIVAVKDIHQLQGVTNTHLALEDVVRDGFSSAFGTRPNVQKAIVVITDGKSMNQKRTAKAAEELKKRNIHTFAIGVGQNIDEKELKMIATSVDNFYSVMNYSRLKDLEMAINQVTCKKPICSMKAADVVFALDSSSSVTDEDFRKEIDFVSKFVTDSVIGPHHVQLGLVTFANHSQQVIKLNDFRDRHELLIKLKGIQRIHGLTYTDLALSSIHQHAFSSSNGGRGSKVKQVVVVITDGASMRPQKTLAEARALHSMNVEVFAVGVGRKVDVVELHNIGSTINNVITVPNFEGFKHLEKKILSDVCLIDKTVTTKAPIVCTTKPADVIFVLDSSSSVKTQDFEKYIAFMNNFVAHAKIGPNHIQVGLFLFANDSSLLIRLNELNIKEQLETRIHDVKRMFGLTFTDKALRDVQTRGFVAKNGGRGSSVSQVAIVITDGASLRPKETKAAAETLRAMNVEIYAIGIGKAKLKELHAISSGDDYVYKLPNFESLTDIEEHLFKKVCHNSSVEGGGNKDGGQGSGGKSDGGKGDGGKDGGGKGDGGNKDGQGGGGKGDGGKGDGGKDGGGKGDGGKEGGGKGDGGNKDGQGGGGKGDGGKGDGGNKDGGKGDGGKGDGGNKDGGKGSGGKGDGGNKDGGNKDGGKGSGGKGDGGNKDGGKGDGGKGSGGKGGDGGKGPSTQNPAVDCSASSKMADVVFLLDNSDSVTKKQFEKQKKMVKKFIASHTIGPQDVQVGVITFAEKPVEHFSIGKHNTQSSLLQAIDNIKDAGQKGSTKMAEALNFAKSQSFQSGSKTRVSSHKVIVIISDGSTDDLFLTDIAAKNLRMNGVNIFCIGIGLTNTFEMKTITGDAGKVLVTPDDSAIDQIKDKIFMGQCGLVKA